MMNVKIYRVKALDSMFESVWFFDRKECTKIIKNIRTNKSQQLVCGSRHIIEEATLRG